MRRPTIHTNKTTENSSYEMIYSILDCVDAINELNSRLDKGEGNSDDNIEEVFHCLSVMTFEMRSLVEFWTAYRIRLKKKSQKKA